MKAEERSVMIKVLELPPEGAVAGKAILQHSEKITCANAEKDTLHAVWHEPHLKTSAVAP